MNAEDRDRILTTTAVAVENVEKGINRIEDRLDKRDELCMAHGERLATVEQQQTSAEKTFNGHVKDGKNDKRKPTGSNPRPMVEANEKQAGIVNGKLIGAILSLVGLIGLMIVAFLKILAE